MFEGMMVSMKRIRVAFVGAGIVGTTLACLLAAHDKYSVLGFSSRTHSSAVLAAERVGEGRAVDDPVELTSAADIIFITTPDDAIADVASGITARGGVRREAVLAHCSGLLTSGVLREHKGEHGVVSLHPLQAFADYETGVDLMPNSMFVIEGDEPGRAVALDIVDAVGASCHIIDPGAKSLYHAAAAVASNYLVVLSEIALVMNERAGIPRDMATKGLYPLLRGTLQNVRDRGTVGALTGPIARGDLGTVQKPLECLQEDRQLSQLYRLLGTLAVDLAVIKGTVSHPRADEMKDLLIGGSGGELESGADDRY